MTHRVRVEVATMWSSPHAPRESDASAVADSPDTRGWVASLSPDERLGLHGRTLTQLLLGEPVSVLETMPDGWVRVAAPWQPERESADGYVGWIRAAHLEPAPDPASAPPPPACLAPPTRSSVLGLARKHLGLRYLWGGTSPWGFDCSGLVHYCHRQTGTVVPRDARAQHAATEPVELGHEKAGDLYFFATDGRVNHVAFVTEPGAVLHATETPLTASTGGGTIEEVALTPARSAALVSAGRFLGTPCYFGGRDRA
jgi:gamma-D-glutamyl-L-lysine dipeptidyl-peptidase